MTEFSLGDGSVGLMPEERIVQLFAFSAPAREFSALKPRDWAHLAAYSLDPDGHVLAFASYADNEAAFEMIQ